MIRVTNVIFKIHKDIQLLAFYHVQALTSFLEQCLEVADHDLDLVVT